MASVLMGWGTDTFGAVWTEQRKLRKKLVEIREDIARITISHEEIKVEQRIIELRFREEVMWRQRARIQWLLEGDHNTIFFHQKHLVGQRKIECNV